MNIAYGTPLLFAALGELLAERSGVLNLGVEGMMLVGAVMGFWTVQRLHTGGGFSLAAAIGVAAVAGAAMALIHAFLVITLRANQIVSGLALTIFAGAAGLSSYLGNDLQLGDSPAKHAFTFTPSISLFVECADEAELDEAFRNLSAGGAVLMPPGNYGFSTKFAWVQDRFGVSWQLNLPLSG